MARISNIALLRKPAHYTLGQRKTIDFFKEFAGFAGSAFDAAMKQLEAASALPAGGPYVCFYNTELEALDIEAGFCAAGPIAAQAPLVCTKIEPRAVVSAIDQGPYEQQDPTLMELFAWLEQNNKQPAGPIFYYYLNDTERPESQYLTEMIIPIVE